MNIPANHQSVMPYLLIKNAQKFLDFTESVFDARLNHLVKYDDNQLFKYAEIEINGSTIMFSDAINDWKEYPAQLFVYVENADDSYQKALDHGATSLMELSDQEYGRTCGITDPTGNVWWITSV